MLLHLMNLKESVRQRRLSSTIQATARGEDRLDVNDQAACAQFCATLNIKIWLGEACRSR